MPNQLGNLLQLINGEELEDQDFTAPIVIVHPRHPNRGALLSYFLQGFSGNIYYFALPNHIKTTHDFLSELAQSGQFPKQFTSSILSTLAGTKNPQAWAEGVGSALNTLEKSAYTLVLDQLDIIQFDSDFSDFFLALANYLPSQVQVLINGCELIRQPWMQLLEQGVANVIGQDCSVGNGNLFRTKSHLGVIEFYALHGQTRVLSDGFQVHTWDGALPRNLCYYFIEYERVTRQQIFDTFWPHLDVKEATNVFHVTKRKISEKLGYEITDYGGGFYIPANEVNIYYDARELEQTYNEALRAPSLATVDKWARIVELYRRPYLLEVDMPWAESKREQIRNYYLQALLELGRYHEAKQHYAQTLNYYLRAVAEKPEREDIHRHVMQVYQLLGNTEAVVHQYKILEQTLRASLNIKPSQTTQALYTEITGKRK